MEKFAIDLDKVLDEFELNEDRAAELAAGRESQPSGYQEFLKASGDNPYPQHECIPLPQAFPPVLDRSTKPTNLVNSVANARYDIPFEPKETLDLSDADFAPSLQTSSGNPSVHSSVNRIKNVLNITPSNNFVSQSSNQTLQNALFEVSDNTISNVAVHTLNGHNVQNSSSWQQQTQNILRNEMPQVNLSSSETSSLASISTTTASSESSYTLNEICPQSSSSFSTSNVFTQNADVPTDKENPDECSADKYMKDIEVVMGLGLPLTSLKYEGLNSDTAATTTTDVSNLLKEIDSETLDSSDSSQVLQKENNLDSSNINKTSASVHNNQNNTKHSTNDTSDITDKSLITATEKDSSKPEISSEEKLDREITSKESSSEEIITDSDKVEKIVISVIADETPDQICDNIRNAEDDLSSTSSRFPQTPFETPSEAKGFSDSNTPDTSDGQFQQESYTTPVGFQEDVEVSDAELEKYLKEVENSEKADLSQLDENPEENNSESKNKENLKVVTELDGFSSGEEFYSPQLERPSSQDELSKLDPYYNAGQLKPDETYEDAKKHSAELDVSNTDGKHTVILDSVPDAGLHRGPKIPRYNTTEAKTEEKATTVEEKIHKDSKASEIQECVEIANEAVCSELNQAEESLAEVTVIEDEETEEGECWTDRRIIHDAINRELASRSKLPDTHLMKEQHNLEIKSQLQSGMLAPLHSPSANRFPVGAGGDANGIPSELVATPVNSDNDLTLMEECMDGKMPPPYELQATNGECGGIGLNASSPPGCKRQRPTSLNLPGKIEVTPSRPPEELGQIPECFSPESPSGLLTGLETIDPEDSEALNSQWDGYDAGAPSTPVVTEDELQLGKVAPFWVPDSEAPNCMQCNTKFTVIKRRHHCRACGKVLCSHCCGMKAKLQYMENKEARVCQQCLLVLNKVQALERRNFSTSSPSSLCSLNSSPLSPSIRPPNPNNPSEYCSTIPPLQQAQANLNAPPPTVLVPVGVLKREGSKPKGEPKQVIFSDGIRPGGDLTELDVCEEPRVEFRFRRRQGRIQKKVEKITDLDSPSQPSQGITSRIRTFRLPDLHTHHFIPDSEDTLPPIITASTVKGDFSIDDNPSIEHLMTTLQDDQQDPLTFAINKNLFVLIKIVTLDCCVNKTCWCFTTKGMCTVGQEEVVIVMEYLPEDKSVPKDIFHHFSNLYDEASQGNAVSDLNHTIFTQSFLDSRDHGGFLYVKPTFQCLNKLILPQHPYVVGILLQKWETPWAKVFPIRLMLRLGAEFRYYPCPLISVRFRKPVYGEIGHTIMNLLADFRNYQYMLPTIKGLVILMEDKQTMVYFPRNRYDEIMRALNNSNDHVLALGGNFSTKADSHLVCIQNDEGSYQTQAINIQDKPRKVTGASFVVFNGALKSSSGLTAKSSIVEDGLMVQIPPDTMLALRQAMRDMRDFTIGCGPTGAEQPDEVVVVHWSEDDKAVNIGVKSPIDGMSMDGISSIHIRSGTDYMGENRLIRWTEVFLIQTDYQINSRRSDPVDISRLSEVLAQACCIALTTHLDSLKEAGLTHLGLRVTIDSEDVGYEIGANGEKLPSVYMNDLDSELVPVIHRAASQSQEGPIILELVFHILEQ